MESQGGQQQKAALSFVFAEALSFCGAQNGPNRKMLICVVLESGNTAETG